MKRENSLISMFEPMARRRGQRSGELWESGGSWLLRYYVDGTEFDESGKLKRERVTVTVARSKGPGAVKLKRDARKIAWEEYLSKLDQAHMRPSSAKTFLEFVNQRYRPDVITTAMKPTTRDFAESILRRHVLPFLGSTPLREITPAHVQAVANSAIKKGLSTQTVEHVCNRIGAVLRHAKAHGWFFGEIPTEAVRLPETVHEEIRAMTWAEVCTLAKVLPEPCATLVIFLVLTGLRISEAMGLRWMRVNLTLEPRIVDGKVLPPMAISVREQFLKGKYQTLKPSRTGRRIIPIPAWFAPRLTALIGTENSAGHLSRETPVFANGTGLVPLDQHNLAARVLKPAATALGMPWVSWHVFRHSYATLTDELDLSMAQRMKLLGHSTAEVTLGYTHPELEKVRPILEAMVNPKLLN